MPRSLSTENNTFWFGWRSSKMADNVNWTSGDILGDFGSVLKRAVPKIPLLEARIPSEEVSLLLEHFYNDYHLHRMIYLTNIKLLFIILIVVIFLWARNRLSGQETLSKMLLFSLSIKATLKIKSLLPWKHILLFHSRTFVRPVGIFWAVGRPSHNYAVSRKS